ncbi:MAG: hypothetical protein EPN98_21810 [Phenylobacterium sp.]|uniref:hypothetical protein n=1 Tax=Phenylobacterium sp. TaxID=1871053 RepID=UPI0011FA9E88|nr:hypothetical protein [Phenylobacterium sp.]TAL29079.1 MAG: hypothetical protein EPN98_21810 [Phenylobacterium sp.]
MGEKLIRVERFEDLKTGMRVVVRPCQWQGRGCGGVHCGILGTRAVRRATGNLGSIFDVDSFTVMGEGHGPVPLGIYAANVVSGRVFRFAADIDVDAQLAAEPNPYLSREVLGTNGRDEVVIAAKERAR